MAEEKSESEEKSEGMFNEFADTKKRTKALEAAKQAAAAAVAKRERNKTYKTTSKEGKTNSPEIAGEKAYVNIMGVSLEEAREDKSLKSAIKAGRSLASSPKK